MRGPHPPLAPLALIAKRDNTLRLAAMDEAALALGLEVGLPLAAARARAPELTVLDADPAADRAVLAAIGEACRRYTPALSLDPPEGVHLDITGAAPLFGGEDALIADLTARLRRQGFTARTGVADTLGLAWALAHYGDPRRPTAVEALPVAALRLDPDSVGVLHRLGLRRVGPILAMPRPALARRLGEHLLHRLDETLGFRGAAVALVPEPEPFYVQHRLAEPIALEHQVLRLIAWLAERLAERLDRRRVGGRTFALELFRVDGARKRLLVQAGRPLRDPRRIAALFTERLAGLNEGLEADFGFDLLRLSADGAEPIGAGTGDLLGAPDDGDFVALIDRLSVRHGPVAVRRLAPDPQSRIPEQAVKTTALTDKAADGWKDEMPAVYNGVLLRPATLFAPPQPIEAIAGVPEDPPERFSWRRLSHRVVRAEGPERIAWEWWRGAEPERAAEEDARTRLSAKPPAPANDGLLGSLQPAPDRAFRDYYRVEDDQGRRFWVFREGAFAPGLRPRWFLHGLFP